MTDERPIAMSHGLPSTVLPAADADSQRALADALARDPTARRDALTAVAARYPRYLDAWAELGDFGRDQIERYAYYRVGYHRGLVDSVGDENVVEWVASGTPCSACRGAAAEPESHLPPVHAGCECTLVLAGG